MKWFFVAAMLLVLPAYAQDYGLKIISPNVSTVLYPSVTEVAIEVAHEPLTPLDTLYVYVDGKTLLINEDKTTLPTLQLGIGTHKIVAQIVNEKGRVVGSDSKDFGILLNPAITQKVRAKEKAEKDFAQYQAMPWYKKAYLHMRQDENGKSMVPKPVSDNDPANGLVPLAKVVPTVLDATNTK